MAGSRSQLERMFAPRSIAVVGASNHSGKRGNHAVRQLLAEGYPYPVYPVNPREPEVLGLPAYPSVAAIGAPVDLAFVATPAGSLPAVLADCGTAGAAGAIAVAAGFAETGETGAQVQTAALAAARTAGVRLLGPNTSGLLNLPESVNLVGLTGVPPGRIGVVSQSGNLLLSIVEAARRVGGAGVGFYAGVGNEADVGFPELLDYLAGVDGVRAVCVYAEGFRRGRATLAALTRAAAIKPVVVLKGGRSVDGTRTAASHTGAVAGDAVVAAAALRRAGAVLVEREDELLPVAGILAAAPVPVGGRVAILADGGGHATLAADAVAVAPGLSLASLGTGTQDRLRDLLGPAAAVTNPVDVAGASDREPARFAEAARLLLAGAGVDLLLVVGLLGGYALRFDASLREAERAAAAALAGAATAAAKPVVVSSVYAGRDGGVLAPLGVPVLASLEVAVRCAAALAERAAWLGTDPPAWPPLPAASATAPHVLPEPEARDLLTAAGVPTGPHRVVSSPEDAVAAARELGGSVALKVVSPDILHKSDVGGIRLGVGPDTAAAELAALLADVRARAPGAAVSGVLVAPMVTAAGVELLVGVRHDATFGPVLTVGAGGTLVELLADVAVTPLPVTRVEARRLLTGLRLAPLLTGYRGAPPVDLDALVDLLVTVGEFALAHPEVRELDLNPVLAHSAGAAILDARILT